MLSAAEIEGARQFRGDGYLIFMPDAKPIELPWSLGLAFRTRQTDTFLMKVEMGPSHFAQLEVCFTAVRLSYRR